MSGNRPQRFIDRFIFAAAVAFSAVQIYTAAFTPLSTLVVRSVHVGFLLLLAFSLYRPRMHPVLGPVIGVIAFILAVYHWVFETDLILRSGDPTSVDLAVGTAVTLLVFEAARRVMGWALPTLCGLFLLYALFGHYLPAPLNHRGYGFDQVVNQLFLGTEGIYGTPTYVSATYIFLFILFGTFLEQAGMIKLFNDVAMGTVGHLRGGPAKVAVVSSALMGTINGSGVANVVVDGGFTIPMMKRFGFKSDFAGAVEATASMGGQIMPPVMGAVAFIMAETLNVPYFEIVKAAAIPAVLYFATVFWMVHLEASRLKLYGLAKSECPNALAAVRRQWYLMLPLLVLVYLLFVGYTPMFAGTVGLALTVVLILGHPIAARLPGNARRTLFWIAVGLGASGFLKYGVEVVFGLVALLVAVLLFLRGGRQTLRLALAGLTEGAKNALSVGLACAIVGVIIGTLTLTGAATSFGQFIVQLGEQSLFLSLLLTMVFCLVLGMGIPTIPNYIITSALAAPALLALGVPLILSHMFVFYFGIMADLTPPVALAAFAAAPFAQTSGLKIGVQCLRIAIAGFVIPFMAIYAPALMLQEGGLADVVYIVLKALLAIGLWGAAAVGYGRAPLTLSERLLAAAGAFLLVAALPVTDEIGFVVAALVIAYHWRRTRAAARAV